MSEQDYAALIGFLSGGWTVIVFIYARKFFSGTRRNARNVSETNQSLNGREH